MLICFQPCFQASAALELSASLYADQRRAMASRRPDAYIPNPRYLNPHCWSSIWFRAQNSAFSNLSSAASVPGTSSHHSLGRQNLQTLLFSRSAKVHNQFSTVRHSLCPLDRTRIYYTTQHLGGLSVMRLSNILLAISFALSASCRPAPPQSTPLPAPPGTPSSAAVKAAPSPTAASSKPAAAATSATGTKPAAPGAGSSDYTTFTGDGSAGAGWPSENKWLSFSDAFNANMGDMHSSCANAIISGQENDSPDEINDIKTAVTSTASSTGVDARVIFAVIMQESHGCVRAKSTGTDASNPGLMQSHGGITCFGINPCPTDKINQMIQDGAGGVNDAAGLKQGLGAATAIATAQKTYQALRIYNSGSLDASGDLAAHGATPC